MFKKHLPLLKEAVSDRLALTVWIGFVILAVIVIITAAIHVQPSELQVTVHYTAFGVTNFYRDSWYYLVVFVLQAALLLIGHTLVTLKLFNQKGRNFALLFLVLSCAVAVIIELLFLGLYNVVSLVQ